MTNANDIRKAHKILDDLFKGNMVLDEEREFLRNSLPELPKQKTLEEIIAHVRDAWVGANDNDWAGNSYDRDISIEGWMAELYVQMNGLIDTPVAVPALPAGMRLADHEQYGRVITSPKPNRNGVYDLLVPRPKFETGADWEYAHECELTFIDAEPAKPAHPEFLETEADYTNAPEGTVVACDNSPAWHKFGSEWVSIITYANQCENFMAGTHRFVLRWGWGE